MVFLFHLCLYDKYNITWSLEDPNFSCRAEKYFTRNLHMPWRTSVSTEAPRESFLHEKLNSLNLYRTILRAILEEKYSKWVKLKDLWAKEFLPNIWMEIRNKFESLKASIQNLKRGFDELEKSRIFISSTIKDLKEHNEGVRGQIQQIEENISNLGSNDYRVEVKLDKLEQ